MATVDEYRQHIQNLLTEHAKAVWDERIQAQTIFDTERDYSTRWRRGNNW